MSLYLKILTILCVVGVVTIAELAALCVIAWVFTPVIGWVKRHGLQAAFLAPFVLCLVYVGSTKTGSVKFPYTDASTRYLYDNGSYVTNDYVHVAFTRSPLVPSTADFCGAVRPAGNTNDEDWVIFLESDFNRVSSPTNIPFVGAQTNDFQFFTTWTPGPTVHTNGIAVILWQQGDATNRLVPYRTAIYANGTRLAPSPALTNGPPISLTTLTTTTTTTTTP